MKLYAYNVKTTYTDTTANTVIFLFLQQEQYFIKGHGSMK